MNRPLTFLAILSLGALCLFSSCRGPQPMVQDNSLQLAYLKDPSRENLEALSKAYATTINRTRKSKTHYPGLYADYAVTLVMLGDINEANKWFNNEVAAFPNSSTYVNELKRQLIPTMAADNTVSADDETIPVQDTTITQAMHDAVINVIEQKQAQDAQVSGDNASSVKAAKDKKPVKKASHGKKKGKKGKKK